MSEKRTVTRYVRVAYEGSELYAVCDEGVVLELDVAPWEGGELTGRAIDIAEAEILVPCEPTKVLAVGLNYASHRDHVEQSEGLILNAAGRPVPSDVPGVFAKFPTSLIPDGAQIVFPHGSTNVHFEGELVVVIGRTARDVSVEEAENCVFGVTIGNDLVDREWLLEDLQWFRAKGADGFGPVGPTIVAGIDYNDLSFETRVNGDIRQQARTSQLVFSPQELISYISQYVTLCPGDLIFTGTPGVTQAISPGDQIEVEIEGLGILSNSVAG